MTNKCKLNDRTVRVSRRKPVPFVIAAAFLLLNCGYLSAQESGSNQPAAPDSRTGVIRQTRLAFKDKEKQIDDLVLKGDRCEAKKQFQEAIDLYNEAKKQADAVPQFKSRSDKCAAKLADAYFYWAQDDYDEAVKSAAEQKYDDAINKLRTAIEKYPPCKEKLEKVIEKYTRMKNGVAFQKKVDEAKPNPEDSREKRVLLRQGQLLYDLKQWDRARGLFEEVLVIDPYNVTAMDYIRRINYNLMAAGQQRFGVIRNARNAETAWEAVAPLINYAETKMESEDTEIRKDSESERLAAKLKNIIIDKISFEDVSVPTAFRYLRQCSKEKDPEKVGVNFVLRGKINETTGGEEPQEAAGGQQNNNAAPADTEVGTLNMMLDNRPLDKVIQYICEQANLRYRVDENAVVIASKDVSLDAVQMVTEVYPVETSVISLQEGQTVQDFLAENGITFETGASAVYKGYIGRLVMTNTPKQHRELVRFLRESDKNDPQVLIQTKFVEVKLNDLEELGFKFQFSRANNNVAYLYADSNSLIPLAPETSYVDQKNITNVYAVDASNKDWVAYRNTVNAGTTYSNTGTSTLYYTKAPLQQSTLSYVVGQDDLLRTFSQARTLESSTKDGLAAEFSVWNRNGYKLNGKIYALDQADSADVLACPRVTALHDTTATIKLVTEQYFPSDWDEADFTMMGNNVPVFTGSVPDLDDATQLGISMEVHPIVDPDLDMIHVLMRPLIRKFTGWDDYSYSVPMRLNDNTEPVNVPNTMKMPRIEQRTVDTSATCGDNGTIVLGGMIRDEVSVVEDKYPILGDLPLIGRFFQTKGRSSQKYNLLIFLSCRLVRPDGSPLRERENRGLPPFKY